LREKRRTGKICSRSKIVKVKVAKNNSEKILVRKY